MTHFDVLVMDNSSCTYIVRCFDGSRQKVWGIKNRAESAGTAQELSRNHGEVYKVLTSRVFVDVASRYVEITKSIRRVLRDFMKKRTQCPCRIYIDCKQHVRRE